MGHLHRNATQNSDDKEIPPERPFTYINLGVREAISAISSGEKSAQGSLVLKLASFAGAWLSSPIAISAASSRSRVPPQLRPRNVIMKAGRRGHGNLNKSKQEPASSQTT